MSFPTYSIADDTSNGVLDLPLFIGEIRADATAIDPDSISIDGADFTAHYADDPTTAQKTALDTVVGAHSGPSALQAAKNKRHREVDAHTRELIAAGYTHSSKQFSLSRQAQRKLGVLKQIRNEGAFSYPLVMNTLDSDSTLSLANAAAVNAMYVAMGLALRAYIDGGTTIKLLINAAANVAAVEAVADTR